MSEKRAPRTPIDWDAIEPHYRAGIRALKDIAREFECSDAGIIKHAREAGWTRNLTGKIKAKADQKVTAALVRAETGSTDPLTEAVRVEVEANVQSRIRLSHRTDIDRSKRIANKLLAALEGLEITEAPSPAAIEANSKPAKADSLPTKFVSLKEQAAILRQLTETQKTLVHMEREAYGIAQMHQDPEDAPPIDPLEGARRLAFALARASDRLPDQSSPLEA